MPPTPRPPQTGRTPLRVLILDDERARHDAFDRQYAGAEVWHAYDGKQFQSAWAKVPRFDVVSFDHDLGYSETGVEVAQWMVARMTESTRPHLCVVHGWNPDGAKAIARLLVAAGLDVERIPFGGHKGCPIDIVPAATKERR